MAQEWEAVAIRALEPNAEDDVSLTLHLNASRNAWVVLGWTGTTGGRPRLTMLWMGIGRAPDLNTFDYSGASESGSIDTAILRSLNLTEVASQWAIARAESGAPPPSRPAHFGAFPLDLLDTDAAKATGFRTVTDLRAAVERLEVSIAYAELVARGDVKPAKTLAERLDLPIQTVRARLQRARQDGYLSSAPGTVSGEVTDKARILNASLVRYLQERSGEWLDDEIRDRIIEEAVEEGWVLLNEREDSDLEAYRDMERGI